MNKCTCSEDTRIQRPHEVCDYCLDRIIKQMEDDNDLICLADLMDDPFEFIEEDERDQDRMPAMQEEIRDRPC